MAERYVCPVCGREVVEVGGAGDESARVPGPPYCENGHSPTRMVPG